MEAGALQYRAVSCFSERRRRRLAAVTEALLDVPPLPAAPAAAATPSHTHSRPRQQRCRPGSDLSSELRRLAVRCPPPPAADPDRALAAEGCEIPPGCAESFLAVDGLLPGDDQLQLLPLQPEAAQLSRLLLPSPLLPPGAPPPPPPAPPPVAIRDLPDPLLDGRDQLLSDAEFADPEPAATAPDTSCQLPAGQLPEPDLTLAELPQLFSVVELRPGEQQLPPETSAGRQVSGGPSKQRHGSKAPTAELKVGDVVLVNSKPDADTAKMTAAIGGVGVMAASKDKDMKLDCNCDATETDITGGKEVSTSPVALSIINNKEDSARFASHRQIIPESSCDNASVDCSRPECDIDTVDKMSEPPDKTSQDTGATAPAGTDQQSAQWAVSAGDEPALVAPAVRWDGLSPLGRSPPQAKRPRLCSASPPAPAGAQLSEELSECPVPVAVDGPLCDAAAVRSSVDDAAPGLCPDGSGAALPGPAVSPASAVHRRQADLRPGSTPEQWGTSLFSPRPAAVSIFSPSCPLVWAEAGLCQPQAGRDAAGADTPSPEESATPVGAQAPTPTRTAEGDGERHLGRGESGALGSSERREGCHLTTGLPAAEDVEWAASDAAGTEGKSVGGCLIGSSEAEARDGSRGSISVPSDNSRSLQRESAQRQDKGVKTARVKVGTKPGFEADWSGPATAARAQVRAVTGDQCPVAVCGRAETLAVRWSGCSGDGHAVQACDTAPPAGACASHPDGDHHPAAERGKLPAQPPPVVSEPPPGVRTDGQKLYPPVDAATEALSRSALPELGSGVAGDVHSALSAVPTPQPGIAEAAAVGAALTPRHASEAQKGVTPKQRLQTTVASAASQPSLAGAAAVGGTDSLVEALAARVERRVRSGEAADSWLLLLRRGERARACRGGGGGGRALRLARSALGLGVEKTPAARPTLTLSQSTETGADCQQRRTVGQINSTVEKQQVSDCDTATAPSSGSLADPVPCSSASEAGCGPTPPASPGDRPRSSEKEPNVGAGDTRCVDRIQEGRPVSDTRASAATLAAELLVSVSLDDSAQRYLGTLLGLAGRLEAECGLGRQLALLQPDQSRAQLQDMLRRGRHPLQPHERRALLVQYRQALAVHGLVRARQLAAQLSWRAATRLLRTFRRTHAQTLQGALDEAVAALETVTAEVGDLPHPRLEAAVAELRRCAAHHTTALLVTETEAAQEVEQALRRHLAAVRLVVLRGEETAPSLRALLSPSPCVAVLASPSSAQLDSCPLQLFSVVVPLLCGPADQLLSRCRQLRVPAIAVSVQLDWALLPSPQLPAYTPAEHPADPAAPAVAVVACPEALRRWQLRRLADLSQRGVAVRARDYRALCGPEAVFPDVSVSPDTCLLVCALAELSSATEASRLVSRARALRQQAARCWLLLVAASPAHASADPAINRREEAALVRLRALLAGVSRLPDYTVRLVRADPNTALHIALDIVLSTYAETGGRQTAPPEEHCSEEERLLLQLPAVNALSAPLLLSRCGPLRQLRGYPLSQLVQQLPELPVRVLAQLQRDLQLQHQQLQQNTPGDRWVETAASDRVPYCPAPGAEHWPPADTPRLDSASGRWTGIPAGRRLPAEPGHLSTGPGHWMALEAGDPTPPQLCPDSPPMDPSQ